MERVQINLQRFLHRRIGQIKFRLPILVSFPLFSGSRAGGGFSS
jgi:hypothetical protein